jgi:hypothetical protein
VAAYQNWRKKMALHTAQMIVMVTLNTNNKIYGLDNEGRLWILEPDSIPLKWKLLLLSPLVDGDVPVARIANA